MPDPNRPRPGDDRESTPASPRAHLAFTVQAEQAGRRADDLLQGALSELSRKEAAQLFAEGRVRVLDKPIKKGDRLGAGSEVSVRAPEAAIIADGDLPLSVLFESRDFVIVDKPAGLATAPLVRTETRSLAAALLARYPELYGVGFREREPGLVHRLDTETSGVVLVARSRAAFLRARELFDERAVEKRYLAVVADGLSDSGRVNERLGPDPSRHGRVRVYEAAPSRYNRLVETRYRVLRRKQGRALVELSVESAFRHQIRAHLAYLGYPIVGDALYGGEAVAALGARHALHASHIAWAGDDVLGGFRAEAALPPELAALLEP